METIQYSDAYEYALEVGRQDDDLLISLCTELSEYYFVNSNKSLPSQERYKALTIPADIVTKIFESRGIKVAGLV